MELIDREADLLVRDTKSSALEGIDIERMYCMHSVMTVYYILCRLKKTNCHPVFTVLQDTIV